MKRFIKKHYLSLISFILILGVLLYNTINYIKWYNKYEILLNNQAHNCEINL